MRVVYIHFNPVKHGLVEAPVSMALFHIPSLRRARSLSDALGRIGTEYSANNRQRI